MTESEFDELVDEIIDERSNRSLVILCSSVIDELLKSILQNYLLPPIKANEDDLLIGDNPLSTFSSRIKMVYRLGLIDDEFRGLLDKIRKIRNDCAHKINIQFNTPPIKEHIYNLKKDIIERPAFNGVKNRYFDRDISNIEEVKLLFVAVCFILEAVNRSIERIEVNNKTIAICQKKMD